jgi:hypothetical protein
VHLTLTSSSWLNQIERFFALLNDKKIRRGSYRSVAALRADITSSIDRHNTAPKPFRWTKSADEPLLPSVVRNVWNLIMSAIVGLAQLDAVHLASDHGGMAPTC